MKPIRLIGLIEGGVLQGVKSDSETPEITFELVDLDDLHDLSEWDDRDKERKDDLDDLLAEFEAMPFDVY
jgi:hypothetical protein